MIFGRAGGTCAPKNHDLYRATLFSYSCPGCASNNIHLHSHYTTQNYGERSLDPCRECDIYFGETCFTPIAGLKTPLSRIIEILKARSEGKGLARTVSISKKSAIRASTGTPPHWKRRLGGLKPPLRLYSLMQQFIH